MEFTVRGFLSALSSVNVGSKQIMDLNGGQWSPNRRIVELFYRTLSIAKLVNCVRGQLVGFLAKFSRSYIANSE